MKNKKTNSKILNSIIKKVIPILKRYNIKRAGIFGSFARGVQKKNSDLDVIIQPPKKMGLEFVGLKLDLEKKLKKKVDLLTYASIHPYLKKYIITEEIKII
ncbi:nucleotidyltransferase domain-containing protein [Candidatus Woesearchaeota archaeon]|nr:nucleotidyltransferase domain-containing protein [Candidatus Woesearchaeota archaeon]